MDKLDVVANLNPRLTFVSDSQEVAPIREHVGKTADGYDSFFVEIADGDYKEVWGMCGIVPFKSKLVMRLI